MGTPFPPAGLGWGPGLPGRPTGLSCPEPPLSLGNPLGGIRVSLWGHQGHCGSSEPEGVVLTAGPGSPVSPLVPLRSIPPSCGGSRCHNPAAPVHGWGHLLGCWTAPVHRRSCVAWLCCPCQGSRWSGGPPRNAGQRKLDKCSCSPPQHTHAHASQNPPEACPSLAVTVRASVRCPKDTADQSTKPQVPELGRAPPAGVHPL